MNWLYNVPNLEHFVPEDTILMVFDVLGGGGVNVTLHVPSK
jgi:hypothetical protein